MGKKICFAILNLKNTNFTETKTKLQYSFKYFIGYENNDKTIMPLCKMLPKMSAYRRDFDETKYVFFHKS